MRYIWLATSVIFILIYLFGLGSVQPLEFKYFILSMTNYLFFENTDIKWQLRKRGIVLQ